MSTTSMNGTTHNNDSTIALALPKGRMQQGVIDLLKDAGINISIPDRGYRPSINLQDYTVKLLKPQNIIEMLASGSRDIGFGGADWVANLGFDNHVIQLLDTELDHVKVVAAGSSIESFNNMKSSNIPIRIASEYEKLTLDWITKNKLNATFVRAFGATESFPPEDADLIVDNTATGSTLKANGLQILDTVFVSSTRLYCSTAAYNNPIKRKRIDELVILLQSVLHARTKQAITFNITDAALQKILPTLPCMRAPTVAQLYHGGGYAVNIVVPKTIVGQTVIQLKAEGATDVIVTNINQIVP